MPRPSSPAARARPSLTVVAEAIDQGADHKATALIEKLAASPLVHDGELAANLSGLQGRLHFRRWEWAEAAAAFRQAAEHWLSIGRTERAATSMLRVGRVEWLSGTDAGAVRAVEIPADVVQTVKDPELRSGAAVSWAQRVEARGGDHGTAWRVVADDPDLLDWARLDARLALARGATATGHLDVAQDHLERALDVTDRPEERQRIHPWRAALDRGDVGPLDEATPAARGAAYADRAIGHGRIGAAIRSLKFASAHAADAGRWGVAAELAWRSWDLTTTRRGEDPSLDGVTIDEPVELFVHYAHRTGLGAVATMAAERSVARLVELQRPLRARALVERCRAEKIGLAPVIVEQAFSGPTPGRPPVGR